MGWFHLPNFSRRRQLIEPVTFVPVRKVFKPMVQIKMLLDLSGWVDGKESRKRWSMPAGSMQMVDEDKAREFVAKRYAEFVHPPREPISADEQAEYDSQVTRISMGG